MSRSLRVSPEYIHRVKSAIKRKGFPSQKFLAMELGLSRSTIANFLNGKPIDYLNFVEICERLELDWHAIVANSNAAYPKEKETRLDVGEPPYVSIFYGRTSELETLKQWIVTDKCQLVAVLGMGGIGKTALAVKVAQEVEGEFDYLIWRSLRYAPSLDRLLTNLIQVLCYPKETYLSDNTYEKISLLMQCLREHRCLLVLDAWENILQGGKIVGHYKEGYEDYRELLRRVGESRHQSCLMLTSREKPIEIALLEGQSIPVSYLHLDGLGEAAQEILKEKGLYTEKTYNLLIEFYRGHPLALILVSTVIRDLFNGNIDEFIKLDTLVMGGIRDLLYMQLQRLTDIEKYILYWLAREGKPVSLPTSPEEISLSLTAAELIDAMQSLLQRSLIERISKDGVALFTLSPVVMEYVTNEHLKPTDITSQ